MTTKITEKNISSLANAGVQWQSVVVADGSTGLTAVAGRGYFINTTSGAQTVTLPTSANVGDVIVLKDYARTWATNNVTIASTLLDGGTTTTTFSTNGQTVTLVRMDNTRGWSLVNEDTTSSLIPAIFITATGGTITTSGDFKIHSFTGDGCFVVSTLGNAPTNPVGGPSDVDYLVVAGGGAGAGGCNPAGYGRGGGGAGGYRESSGNSGPYTASPLATPTGITLTLTTYPITVGAGAATTPPSAPSGANGGSGTPSTALGITSAGGGGGGLNQGINGGSGGGAGDASNTNEIGGTGNTPPVSPSQGFPGGLNFPCRAGGGGGGATVAGSAPNPSHGGGLGGTGATTSISGTPTAYAGGGGGGGNTPFGPTRGLGGTGGGGNGGGYLIPGGQLSTAGTTNRGGGGGGGGYGGCVNSNTTGGAGGSGIVVIRYKFQ